MLDADRKKISSADVPLRRTASGSDVGFQGMGTEPGTDARRDQPGTPKGNRETERNGTGNRSEKERGLIRMYGTAVWQEAERIWELESFKKWENQQTSLAGQYKSAIDSMGDAEKKLNGVVEILSQAANDVSGLPLENKIIDLMQALEDLGIDIRTLKGLVSDGYEN